MLARTFIHTYRLTYIHVYIRPHKHTYIHEIFYLFAHLYSIHSLVIEETGDWDTATSKGVQHLLNRVHHADDFEEAAAAYQGMIQP